MKLMSGYLVFREGRGYTDIDSVEVRNGREAGGGSQFALLHQGMNEIVGHILYIGHALIEARNFPIFHIDAGYLKAGASEFHGKGGAPACPRPMIPTRVVRLRILSWSSFAMLRCAICEAVAINV